MKLWNSLEKVNSFFIWVFNLRKNALVAVVGSFEVLFGLGTPSIDNAAVVQTLDSAIHQVVIDQTLDSTIHQVVIDQTLDSTIHWINRYPMDK